MMKLKLHCCPISHVKKSAFVFLMFMFCSNISYSQRIGEGMLLNEKSLEVAIMNNSKSGLNKYSGIFINHHFILDISEKKVSDQQLIESVKGLSGVLDVSLSNDVLVIVTAKENGILPVLKQHLSNINIRLISKTEEIYKI
jgi:hypothetical protein